MGVNHAAIKVNTDAIIKNVDETKTRLQNDLYEATCKLTQQETEMNKCHKKYMTVGTTYEAPSHTRHAMEQTPNKNSSTSHADENPADDIIWIDNIADDNANQLSDNTERPPSYEDTRMTSSPHDS